MGQQQATPDSGGKQEAAAAALSAPDDPGFFGRHGNVYTYVPNLIGYVRVVAALYAFGVALRAPTACIGFYFLSFVCDELDGRFARMLHQTSTLGAVLDMVTDRLATTGLLLLLAVLYPNFIILAVALIFLDIFSHWFQMYSTLLAGAASHKDTRSASWLVRTYYKHRLFMGFCCVCCEVLYLSLYGLAFEETRAWQVGGRVPLLALIAGLSVPGMLVKQICNVAQLRASAAVLVAHDIKTSINVGVTKKKPL